MRQKLTKQEVKSLKALQERINNIWDRFDESEVELHYGNGTASSQMSCAYAAIETILQEFRED